MDKALNYFRTIDPDQFANDVQFEASFMTAPHSSYALEEYISYLVSQGNLDAFDQMLAAYKENDSMLIMGKLSKNPLRQMQYFTVASITLVSRTAIASGMSETSAYELSDAIIQRIDSCKTPEAVAHILLMGVRRYIEIIHTSQVMYAQNPHIRKALIYINEHCNEKKLLPNLAAELSLNKSYLCKLFKKETGKTLTDYIFVLKIEQAKRLLLEEKYQLNEIGTFLGFSSQSYFIQIFRRYTGTTPSKWLAERS